MDGGRPWVQDRAMTTSQQKTNPMSTHDTDSSAGSRAVAPAVLLVGTFMAALDAAIANVAAPEIETDLAISGTSLVLALSGYTLSYAMLLITGARLGDDYGHRRLFLLGLAGFTAASLACGVAASGALLIAARVIQGAACALMTPQVATIIQLRYEGSERARALALFATVLAVGVVAGQVLGGVLVSADLAGLSWRPVFLVNVPIGIALLIVGARTLPYTKAPLRRRLDLGGVALASSALLLVLLPLLLGRNQGWPAWIFVSMVGGVAVAVMASFYFRALGRRGGSPLVDPRIVSDGSFTVALGSLFASTAAWGGFLISFTLFLQSGLGYSPLHSGLAFIPYGAGFAVTSLTYGKLPDRVQAQMPVAGLVLAAAAYAALGVVDRSGWHPTTSAILLALAGGGYGLGFSPVMTTAVERVPLERARDASGILTTAIQVSYAVGLTALGSLFLGRAGIDAPDASGHAFMTVTMVVAGLALAAAWFAALAAGRPRRFAIGRLTPDLSSGHGSADR
jgi:EmrB/QacA subfamily drug resistance transporter